MTHESKAKARLWIAFGVLGVGLFVAALSMLWSGGRSAVRKIVPDDAREAFFADDGESVGGVASRPVTVSGSGRVRAQVVDPDGLPLSEGTVVLSCLRDGEVQRIRDGALRIGEEGWIEGPGCRAEICAELMHPAFVPAEPWVLRPGGEHVVVARPLPRLHGEVVDAEGEPVPAATVAFVAPLDADPTAMLPLVSRSTTTDADGAFSAAWIERPPCGPCEAARGECDARPLPLHDRITVFVRADGLVPAQVAVDALDPPGTDLDAPLRIELSSSDALLSGRLTDMGGRGYPRAFVLARSRQRPHEQHRADVVDAEFELDGLGEGTYDLRALQDGVELTTVTDVRAGEAVELLGEPSADGPDVVLEVRVEGGSAEGIVVVGGPFRGDRTDMEGKVRAEQVLAGEYLLRLRGPGRRPSVHTVTIEPLEGAAARPDEQHVTIELASSPSRG